MYENSGIYKHLNKLKCHLQSQIHKNPDSVRTDNIKKCSREIDNLIKTLSHENLEDAFIERVNSRIKELDLEILSLKAEQAVWQKSVINMPDREHQVNQLSMELFSLKAIFPTLSIEEKRTLIKQMVKKIVWDGKNLHIYLDSE
jgi:site-specific DNA recombinase